MPPEVREISQADLARKLGVTRAAVSQWKAKDILRDDAFTKPGKTGKVIYAVAVEQVRRNRDLGQSLGNGISTRTTLDAPQTQNVPISSEKPALTPPKVQVTHDWIPAERRADESQTSASGLPNQTSVTVEDQLKSARLEEQRRKNRMGAAEEALQQGKLMSAQDARDQMTRVATMMFQIFEGSLTDFAAAIASQFDLPQRDVLHLLKNEFRAVRQTATNKERARLSRLQKNTTVSIELDA